MPSLASALDPDRGASGRELFVDRLAEGLKRRLAAEPAPLNLFAQAMVISPQRLVRGEC
jgi:hypothetical protein